MESEALRKIKTMRYIKTSLDVVRTNKIRRTNSLSKSKEEVNHLESLTDRQLEEILAKERKRIAAFNSSVEKSRQGIIKSRERLAVTINKNRALIELRHQLQRAHWEEKNDPTLPKVEQPNSQRNLHEMKLRY
jgi:hypothetical protein